ncbi:MAG: hypothetical protein M1832_002489 [Thelocarpon impressellum]|nr:MAG: hypothetical protein M1832_002489 [Thelocarpon impressellum]
MPLAMFTTNLGLVAPRAVDPLEPVVVRTNLAADKAHYIGVLKRKWPGLVKGIEAPVSLDMYFDAADQHRLGRDFLLATLKELARQNAASERSVKSFVLTWTIQNPERFKRITDACSSAELFTKEEKEAHDDDFLAAALKALKALKKRGSPKTPSTEAVASPASAPAAVVPEAAADSVPLAVSVSPEKHGRKGRDLPAHGGKTRGAAIPRTYSQGMSAGASPVEHQWTPPAVSPPAWTPSFDGPGLPRDWTTMANPAGCFPPHGPPYHGDFTYPPPPTVPYGMGQVAPHQIPQPPRVARPEPFPRVNPFPMGAPVHRGPVHGNMPAPLGRFSLPNDARLMASGPGSAPIDPAPDFDPETTLWVGGIPGTVSEDVVRQAFGNFGQIRRLLYRRCSIGSATAGRFSRRFAFIQYERVADARAAQANANGRMTLDGCTVDVRFKTPRSNYVSHPRRTFPAPPPHARYFAASQRPPLHGPLKVDQRLNGGPQPFIQEPNSGPAGYHCSSEPAPASDQGRPTPEQRVASAGAVLETVAVASFTPPEPKVIPQRPSDPFEEPLYHGRIGDTCGSWDAHSPTCHTPEAFEFESDDDSAPAIIVSLGIPEVISVDVSSVDLDDEKPTLAPHPVVPDDQPSAPAQHEELVLPVEHFQHVEPVQHLEPVQRVQPAQPVEVPTTAEETPTPAPDLIVDESETGTESTTAIREPGPALADNPLGTAAPLVPAKKPKGKKKKGRSWTKATGVLDNAADKQPPQDTHGHNFKRGKAGKRQGTAEPTVLPPPEPPIPELAKPQTLTPSQPKGRNNKKSSREIPPVSPPLPLEATTPYPISLPPGPPAPEPTWIVPVTPTHSWAEVASRSPSAASSGTLSAGHSRKNSDG